MEADKAGVDYHTKWGFNYRSGYVVSPAYSYKADNAAQMVSKTKHYERAAASDMGHDGHVMETVTQYMSYIVII